MELQAPYNLQGHEYGQAYTIEYLIPADNILTFHSNATHADH